MNNDVKLGAPHYFSAERERCLIGLAQSGDKNARDQLVLAAVPKVKAALRRRYPSIPTIDRDDVTQEAITALCHCLDRYDLERPAHVRLYVYALKEIHKSVCRLYGQTDRIDYTAMPPELVAPDNPETEACDDQQRAIMSGALARLSPRDRDVITHRMLADQPLPREFLASRYNCSQQAIPYAEAKASRRLLVFLPKKSDLLPTPQ